MGRMFLQCKSLEEIDLSKFNTSSVTTMNDMFSGCSNLKKLDIDSFDTFQVKNMTFIFYQLDLLESADVSHFILYKMENDIIDLFGNVERNPYLKQMYNILRKIKDEENIIKDIDSNVVMEIKIFPKEERATYVFGPNFKLQQISQSIMYVDNVGVKLSRSIDLEINQEHNIRILLEGNLYDASNMFEECKDREITFYKNFTVIKRRIFDKSFIRNMNSMFKIAQNITMDFSFFNTLNVEDMGEMFFRYYNNKLINLSSIDTSSVKNMSYMFQYSIINTFDFSQFNTKKATDMKYMFHYAAFEPFDISSFDTSLVTNMKGMFSYIRTPFLNLSKLNTSLVEDMSYMFDGCGMSSLNLSTFDMKKVKDISYMFRLTSKLKNLTLWKFDINSITTMQYTFSQTAMKSLDLSNINTTGLENMYYTFSFSAQLKYINFGKFDTSLVTTIKYLFQDCYSLESIDLSNFNTSQVMYMNGLFSGCEGLKSINISSFDMKKVDEINYMFSKIKLEYLDISYLDKID